MMKRMILMLLAVAVFAGVLYAFKRHQIQGAIAKGSAFQPPPEAVTTVLARQEEWSATVKAIGTVTAVQGVTVSADQPGVVEKVYFDSGRAVRKGDVLVHLDTRQEEAQLAAAESARDLARLSLDRMKGLKESGVIAVADYDKAAAEFTQGDAKVGEIRATIARKTIRAPFSGVLGIRQVNLGQYLASGAPMVSLQTLQPIYVDFAVPQQQVVNLRSGTAVLLTPEKGAAEGKETTGKITAIDSVVDPATRNIQVRATFANADNRLHPGMYVEPRIVLGASQTGLVLPASAISYAPYGDSVFVVEDMKGPNGKTFRGVRQQFVKLGGTRGDQVAVVSGLKPGEEVVTSGVFKLRSGAAVLVNNQIQPANSATPRPEDS
jgi:membrane fusion protein (multidrug efflux system)